MQYRNTKRLTFSALLTTLALMLSYIEAIIPFNFGVPGIKLGLANLVVLIALYKLDARYAFTINALRIVLAGLLFTSPFAMLYSLAGGIFSLLVMWLLKKTDLFSIIGVSMAGGVAHNMAQLFVASILVENMRMFIFFPILVFSGIVTGIGIGICAYYVNERVRTDEIQ